MLIPWWRELWPGRLEGLKTNDIKRKYARQYETRYVKAKLKQLITRVSVLHANRRGIGSGKYTCMEEPPRRALRTGLLTSSFHSVAANMPLASRVAHLRICCSLGPPPS